MSCTIDRCYNKLYSKGFCKMHYDKNRRQGDPNFKRDLKNEKPCAAGNCMTKVFANGLCPKHNRRLQRHGDPNYINPKCNRDGKSEDRRKEYYDNWLEENWSNQMAYRATRKSRVKQATPKWADLEAIQQFYLNCPKGCHVDHKEPLFNKDVCGLHVIDNLQYLTAEENLKKSNKRIK